MTKFRTALTLKVLPGREDAYLEWLTGSMPVLGPVFARTGICEKVVLMADQCLIAHYEADRPGAVEAAFSAPEAVELLAGPLAALLDPTVGPVFHPGVLAWTMPVNYSPRRVALMLSIKAGQEAAYLTWAQDHATQQCEAAWKRHELARAELLISERSVVAYYECRDSAGVLKTFREPELTAAMPANLGPLLELDAAQPLKVFDEIFIWRAAGA